MTPHFYTASNGQTATASQIIGQRTSRFGHIIASGLVSPLAPPTSDLVTPSWVPDAGLICAMKGGAS